MKGTSMKPLSRRTLLLNLAALPIAWPQSRALGLPSNSSLPADPLDVMDFESLARKVLPVAHFEFIETGTDDDLTVARNREAYLHYEIRSRRFVDVGRIDTTRLVYGSRWTTPFYLSAVSSQKAFHTDGELATARAARTSNTQMMLSNVASVGVESVIGARQAPVWQQLYPTDDFAVTEGVIARAARAGCSTIVLTVDSMPGRNNETLKRAMRRDSRPCTSCHLNGSHDPVTKAPMYAGLDLSRVSTHTPTNITLPFVDRLRALVKGKLLIKGIVTAEDAALAVAHGVDGIIISNHGGRSEETLRSTLECLPEIAAEVAGRVPVFLDGGIRRGTDIFKAIALGATAVGIGRPQVWGLAAAGQAGVEAVIDMLQRELVQIMRQAGAPDLAGITRNHVIAARW